VCSVFGAIITNPNSEMRGTLTEIFSSCMERGKDSWGLTYQKGVVIYEMKSHKDIATFHSFAFVDQREFLPMTIIGNRRGEPTSEWVKEKSIEDVQPFRSPNKQWAVTHNGTISNDKEILAELKIDPPTRIDSYCIGAAFEEYGFRETVTQKLNSGSAFAILAMQKGVQGLFFATNYKPLFVRRFSFGYVFASQKKYLMAPNEDLNTLIENCSPIEIPPYTAGFMKGNGHIDTFDLYATKYTRKRVLVVCSGGLDSGTVAWMYHKQGYEVELFHLKYNCHAESEEIKAVRALGEVIGCQVHEVSTDFFSKCAPSSLTEDRGINVEGSGEAGAEVATEWCPARNTVLYALALAFAEAHNHDIVALGGNIEESGAFPDNEQEFTNKWNDLSPYAVKPYSKIEITSPFAAMVKHEIVKLGLELEMPFELTYSCYKGEEKPCWSCGPDFMRKKAFEMNGVVDPLFAKNNQDPKEFTPHA